MKIKTSLIVMSIATLMATLTSSAMAGSKACTVTMSSKACDEIKKYIQQMYVPGKWNNYSRHRSFLNMEANKIRNNGKFAYKYEDNSSLAYGQGQLWLALSPVKRKQALTIKPEDVQKWMMANVSPEKKAVVQRDVAAFNKLDENYRVKWMAMKRDDRIAVAKLADKVALQAEITKRGAPFSFNPYKYEADQFIAQWKLFD